MDTFSTFHCGIVFSTVSKLVISMVPPVIIGRDYTSALFFWTT